MRRQSRQYRKALRKRCAAAARPLVIPAPFHLDEIGVCLERCRRRAVRLTPVVTKPGTPSGVWVRAPDADYLYYEELTSAFHQVHIVFHLAAGMLLSDEPGMPVDPRLVAGLTPRLVSLMLGDNAATPVTHLEAETFAFLVMNRASRPVSRSMAMRSLRQLRSLRTAVLDAAPEARGTATSPGLQSARARLHRTVVQIRDAALVLRPYRDPEVAATARAAASAARLTAEDAAAAVEAAVVADASRARKAGLAPKSEPHATEPGWAINPDLRSETDWLLKVSRALADRPLGGQLGHVEPWANPQESAALFAVAEPPGAT
jgi:hypothetical protein